MEMKCKVKILDSFLDQGFQSTNKELTHKLSPLRARKSPPKFETQISPKSKRNDSITGLIKTPKVEDKSLKSILLDGSFTNLPNIKSLQQTKATFSLGPMKSRNPIDSKANTEVSNQSSHKLVTSQSVPVLNTQASDTPQLGAKPFINLKKLESLKTGK